MRYYLGVDGGTTKTHAVLADSAGEILGFSETSGSNHECLPGGYSDVESILQWIIGNLVQKRNIPPQKIKGVFGLSGVDTKKDEQALSAVISRLDLGSFRVCNDSYLGIWAGTEQGEGICSINGTGCTVTGRDKEGGLKQLGGLGSHFGDPGGGGTIGRFVLSEVFNDVHMNGGTGLMSAILLGRGTLQEKKDSLEDLRDQLVRKSVKLTDFAPVAFQAAQQGDEKTTDFLCRMGSGIGRRIAYMADNMVFSPEIPVVLAGSLNVRGHFPAMEESLKKEAIQSAPRKRLTFHMLETPPVAGALLWAAGDNSGDKRGADFRKFRKKAMEQWENKCKI